MPGHQAVIEATIRGATPVSAVEDSNLVPPRYKLGASFRMSFQRMGAGSTPGPSYAQWRYLRQL